MGIVRSTVSCPACARPSVICFHPDWTAARRQKRASRALLRLHGRGRVRKTRRMYLPGHCVTVPHTSSAKSSTAATNFHARSDDLKMEIRATTAVLASRSFVCAKIGLPFAFQSGVRNASHSVPCTCNGGSPTLGIGAPVMGVFDCDIESETAAGELYFLERRIGLPDRRKLPRMDRRTR
jgi:hypothetical protein